MIADELKRICGELSCAVDQLSFGQPVTHVYNPLDYAWNPVSQYLEKAGSSRKEAIFLGMNPGPWGMAQTGVPFGTVNMVREWIGIHGPVGKPPQEHPKRPIDGFEVSREEVSGNRFWGWARDRFTSADRFFARFFVANYCPLVFMEASGKNRTPDKLPVAEQEKLFELCDEALRQVVGVLEPKRIIAVGKFAEDRAIVAMRDTGIQICRILHPSPASPVANRGWSQQAEIQLARMGVVLESASGETVTSRLPAET